MLFAEAMEQEKAAQEKNAFRKHAYERLISYRMRSGHPKYEFSGQDATVVLSKEKFFLREGQLAGTFIFYAETPATNAFLRNWHQTSLIPLSKERLAFP